MYMKELNNAKNTPVLHFEQNYYFEKFRFALKKIDFKT